MTSLFKSASILPTPNATEPDVLSTWRQRADNVRGKALDCGHFLAEERPEEVTAQLLAFLAADRAA
ncbi:alpha/beta fold hydrolase [Actinoplanes sp. NPDC051513]|uniref:alpha/beta fold hydrolase n=1 Tax=Actinoplanes sp. NPDC051513 TaxID=3363908 RepID=UPI00379AD32D